MPILKNLSIVLRKDWVLDTNFQAVPKSSALCQTFLDLLNIN